MCVCVYVCVYMFVCVQYRASPSLSTRFVCFVLVGIRGKKYVALIRNQNLSPSKKRCSYVDTTYILRDIALVWFFCDALKLVQWFMWICQCLPLVFFLWAVRPLDAKKTQLEQRIFSHPQRNCQPAAASTPSIDYYLQNIIFFISLFCKSSDSQTPHHLDTSFAQRGAPISSPYIEDTYIWFIYCEYICI